MILKLQPKEGWGFYHECGPLRNRQRKAEDNARHPQQKRRRRRKGMYHQGGAPSRRLWGIIHPLALPAFGGSTEALRVPWLMVTSLQCLSSLHCFFSLCLCVSGLYVSYRDISVGITRWSILKILNFIFKDPFFSHRMIDIHRFKGLGIHSFGGNYSR